MKKIKLLTLSLCLLIGTWVSGQEINVSGKVSDSKGEPLIGVSVKLVGTQSGTISSVTGEFSIPAKIGDKLEFSYIGYATQAITLQSKKVNIILTEDARMLDEVVAIGYGTQKKSDLTGSLSSVNSSDISKSSSSNISQILQGKATGVYVTSNSGAPGSGATIRIRGYGSISTDLTPLYVVDGQPIGESQVNQINPQDIENVEILKDASACAIYGARGANGIILITTKSGKSGKSVINLDVSYGSTNVVNRINMMNSDQLYGFINEAYINDGLRMPRGYKNLYFYDGVGKGPNDADGNPTDINVYNTDWWRETTQQGIRKNYNLSISTGSDKMSSYFSLGRYEETGTIKTSDYVRTNIRMKNEYKLNKSITIGQTLGASYGVSHDLNMPITEILLADPFTPVISPTANAQDPNYEYNKYMGSQYSYYGNPVSRLNRTKKENISRNIDGTVYANINLGIKGLYFNTLLGFENPNYNYNQFDPSFDLRPNDLIFNMNTNVESKYNLVNTVTNASSWSLNYSFQNTLSYANKFGKHDLSVMVGQTWESNSYQSYSAMKSGVPNNNEAFRILGAATVNASTDGYKSDNYLISYLGRFNYSYDNKYLATISFRRDGSSKFAEGNRWGNFPSFSLGWRVDQEDFFKKWEQPVISSIKLRGGWGQNGNQNIPAFSYANTVGTSEIWVYAFNNGKNLLQGYGSTSTGNPDIRWETSEQANLGLDLSFFKSSLTLSTDVFLKTTRDMLLQNPIPIMSGYQNTPWVNAGSVENKGLEISLGYKGNVGDFKYGINSNFTIQRNKLVSTGTNSNPIYGSVSKNVVGDEFGKFYGYKYVGIFQTQDEINSYVGADGVTKLQPLAKPGDFKYENITLDNKLNDDDRTYIGNPNPGLIYGGSVNLEYKGIDLGIFVQGVAGNDIWANSKSLYRGTSTTNLLEGTYTEAWRQAGDKTDIPRVSRNDMNNNFRASSWFVQDGSFCKIKSVQIGYSIPEKVIKATKVLQSVRIYGSAENILTLSKFKFMDPEVPNGNALNMGIENTQYPNPRVMVIGLNFQF